MTESVTAKTSGRLLSLDVFRGATIAGMMMVNNPGSWSHIYPPFEHAAWNGWTFTDLIFPFFLWIVGVAMTFSFSKRVEQGADRHKLMMHTFSAALVILRDWLVSQWISIWIHLRTPIQLGDNPDPRGAAAHRYLLSGCGIDHTVYRKAGTDSLDPWYPRRVLDSHQDGPGSGLRSGRARAKRKLACRLILTC